MFSSNRLDILLYAHDGRGLGHASRTIAIGLALRRLYPSLKILFLSGCKFSQELICGGTLDWIKLPSYETTVIKGKSAGSISLSNYQDKELGQLRAQQIKQIVDLYKPRLVLADHSPQGKHKELLPAMKNCGPDTQWVLGIRGVVGNVSQLSSDIAQTTFNSNYSGILWYGDSTLLGTSVLSDLKNKFAIEPNECGYVSRLSEVLLQRKITNQQKKLYGGIVSVPWFTDNSIIFLNRLFESLNSRNLRNSKEWVFFLDDTHKKSQEVKNLFTSLPFCRIEKPSARYTEVLPFANLAIIDGGYNSIVDVFSQSIPSLILLREMQDMEQQLHVQKLLEHGANSCKSLEENCTVQEISASLEALENASSFKDNTINFSGAERSAHFLMERLRQKENLA